MRKTFKPEHCTRSLIIPPEIVGKTELKNADSIDAYGTDAALLLMDEAMTPMEMVKTADMLHTAVMDLVDRLAGIGQTAADFSVEVHYTPDSVSITIPKPLFENAGIPLNTPLTVDVDEGEIYITEAFDGEDDDPLEHVPEYLKDVLGDRGLPPGLLGCLLRMEEKFHE